MILPLLCAVSAAYQLFTVFACLLHLRRGPAVRTSTPGVSILKPVRGVDPNFYEAICSHARIEYPVFEILFGIRDSADPARASVERLRSEFPNIPIRIIHAHTDAPNPKVGILQDLAAEARHPLLVINDSDISVAPDYLTHITAELNEPGVGLVTCLYRATASSFPATLEALGVATDFAPGVLVAPLAGVKAFGLGSTLALARSTLQRIGGFESIRAYLADDYQLGKRISSAGGRIRLSQVVVTTHMSGSWREVWLHQLRWARTVRISQSGYFGLPATWASVWGLLAIIAGHPQVGFAVLTVRLAAALLIGGFLLRDPLTWRCCWLIPARDLFGAAVWFGGALGTAVLWRGKRLRLDSEGRILI